MGPRPGREGGRTTLGDTGTRHHDPANDVVLKFDPGREHAGPLEKFLASGRKLPVVLLTCNRADLLRQTIRVTLCFDEHLCRVLCEGSQGPEGVDAAAWPVPSSRLFAVLNRGKFHHHARRASGDDRASGFARGRPASGIRNILYMLREQCFTLCSCIACLLSPACGLSALALFVNIGAPNALSQACAFAVPPFLLMTGLLILLPLPPSIV